MDAFSPSKQPSRPCLVDPPPANTNGSNTKVAAVNWNFLIPRLPPIPQPNSNFATADATVDVENEAAVGSNSTTFNNNITTTPLKTTKQNNNKEGVKGTADEDNNAPPYIASPASKFPVKQQKNQP